MRAVPGLAHNQYGCFGVIFQQKNRRADVGVEFGGGRWQVDLAGLGLTGGL